CGPRVWSLEFAGASKQPLSIMIKRLHGLALVAIIVVLAPVSAHAQSADLVLCDRLAADAADPDKPADVKGVAEVAPSDIETAIKFCRKAAGGSRRAMYELGRAYAANRTMPDAIAAWRKAADKGSTSAMVELGVLYGTGAASRQSARRQQPCRPWRRREDAR